MGVWVVDTCRCGCLGGGHVPVSGCIASPSRGFSADLSIGPPLPSIRGRIGVAYIRGVRQCSSGSTALSQLNRSIMTSHTFATSAPGKVIIFGEHSAVYGKPAVAASASSMRSYLLVQPGEQSAVSLHCPDIHLDISWELAQLNKIESVHTLGEKLNPRLTSAITTLLEEQKLPQLQHSAALCFLYLYLSIVPSGDRTPTRFTLRSTLPVGAGLGSSASVSVAVAQACLTLCSSTGISPPLRDSVNDWAFVGEMCIHGDPSGIDNAIATHGGALLFAKDSPEPPRRLVPPCPIVTVLTYTGIPRSTKTLVAGVRSRYEAEPAIFGPLLDSMGALALRGCKALEEGDLAKVLELVQVCHGQLVSLGVSHPGLEVVRVLTDELQLGQTKLTGAGGGGCSLTLLSAEAQEAQVARFKNELQERYGYKTFETALGGSGCSIVDMDAEGIDPLTRQTVLDIFAKQDASREELDNWLLPDGPTSLPWQF